MFALHQLNAQILYELLPDKPYLLMKADEFSSAAETHDDLLYHIPAHQEPRTRKLHHEFFSS